MNIPHVPPAPRCHPRSSASLHTRIPRSCYSCTTVPAGTTPSPSHSCLLWAVCCPSFQSYFLPVLSLPNPICPQSHFPPIPFPPNPIFPQSCCPRPLWEGVKHLRPPHFPHVPAMHEDVGALSTSPGASPGVVLHEINTRHGGTLNGTLQGARVLPVGFCWMESKGVTAALPQDIPYYGI